MQTTVVLFLLLLQRQIKTLAYYVPTLTLQNVEDGIYGQTNPLTKKSLEGILSDYMDLQYGKRTPYTTGKRVLPRGTTIANLEDAISDSSTDTMYKNVFVKISDTFKSGDLSPQSPNDGSWDRKLKPVLVLIKTKK